MELKTTPGSLFVMVLKIVSFLPLTLPVQRFRGSGFYKKFLFGSFND
ncbi:hypothetical protein Cabys_3613 [Caldithrix abyssi DSM 13497]|uniref:Uncharacterized protein n=1 Tax=Caldithrix abyssi DSM 13497 TaxID=880073 RepID=A0A1J1CCG0_CALAY|nr:hypothetical protein Cabys_3613 [Caldithrix abyssi DSM 13497]